jgi:hypothetical protein
MQQPFALLSGALAIMHPDLYMAGRTAFDNLRARLQSADNPHASEFMDMALLLQGWATVYSGASVMVNRSSPWHRDINSCPQWFDLLASIGDYCGINIDLPTIGASLPYGPRTVIAFCGKLICHWVLAGSGNRMCLAFYMWDNVHEAFQVNRSDWCIHRELCRVLKTITIQC